MNKETIKVSFVNPPKPGKKIGSLKTSDDKIFGVWPDKLERFTPGKSYEIEYESREFNGNTYHTIKAFSPVDNGQQGTNGNGVSAHTAEKESLDVYLRRSALLLRSAHKIAQEILGDGYDHEDARSLYIDARRKGYLADIATEDCEGLDL